jgi:replication factor C subunit 1
VVATTASAYFSNPTQPGASQTKAAEKPTPKRQAAQKLAMSPASEKKPKNYGKRHDPLDLDNDDDIFTNEYKNSGRAGDDYEEESDLEEDMPQPKTMGRGKKVKVEDDDFVIPKRETPKKKAPAGRTKKAKVEDDEDELLESDDIPKKKPTQTRKRKSGKLDDDDDDEPPAKKPTKARTPRKAKQEPVQNSASIQEILDGVPLIVAPLPPKRDSNNKWNASLINKSNQAVVPAGAGMVEKPTGQPFCLAGLQFVFTGVLSTLPRDEGANLVKQYGGKVQSAPTTKTSFVVLGGEAGPSKLETIHKHKLKCITEEGLYYLIAHLPAHGGGPDSAAGAAAEEKVRKETAKAADAAREMEEQEKAEKLAQEKLQKQALVKRPDAPPPKAVVSDANKLWTVKYAPTLMSHIVGNKIQVERLQDWLHNFRKHAKLNFKTGGKHGMGTYRAVIIYGPPGIGKTTAAHLVAKLEGYDVVETNASDARSKRLVDEGLRGILGTTSLLGYFSGDGKDVNSQKRNLVLIMDEVDGMSSGDRGGVGALAAVCKKSIIPIILICNERKQPKMRPFDYAAFDLPFRRPTTDQIRSRIMTIAFKENMKIPPHVANALIEGTGADIRQVVNMISTVKLDAQDVDFNDAKAMSKAWEKHTALKPWDMVSKILGGGMFAANSKATLSDKTEIYFNDHEFAPLMLQENYLSTQPMRANGFEGPERRLKLLELAEGAAASISDGDLVDRLIHGSQQQWSLLPTHSVFSFVRPASFVWGSQGYAQTSFTSWLGNNSKQAKLSRMVKEIQSHIRLRTAADRHEVRQLYVPMFWSKTAQKLSTGGKAVVPEVIDVMDTYYLTRDDYDAICELGIGDMDEKNLKIEKDAKATFTRMYVLRSHLAHANWRQGTISSRIRSRSSKRRRGWRRQRLWPRRSPIWRKCSTCRRTRRPKNQRPSKTKMTFPRTSTSRRRRRSPRRLRRARRRGEARSGRLRAMVKRASRRRRGQRRRLGEAEAGRSRR